MKYQYHRWRSKLAYLRRQRRTTTRLAAMSAVAMSTSATASKYTNQVIFDTDSYPIGIDNRCSGCISHQASDFTGPLVDSNRTIKGFGGTKTKNVKIGTLVWRWADDQGLVHRFEIPGSYYVPQGQVRLLSPQHWAKSQKPKTSAREITTHDRVELHWNNGNNKLTVPLGKTDNVATLISAPGNQNFGTFCHAAEMEDETEFPQVALPAQLVSDDDSQTSRTSTSTAGPYPVETVNSEGEDSDIKPTTAINFENGRPTVNVIPNEIQFSPDTNAGAADTPQAKHKRHQSKEENTMSEMLRDHQRLGHISFDRIREMARQGLLPKRYVKCPTPACSACLYGKATRKKWRTKTPTRGNLDKRATHPGAVVSVDQLESPTPGLIAQMSGFMTKQRYKCATVYVDQASRLGYVHMQKSSSAEETIEGKRAFERYARDHGVRVEAYHADNGIFRAHKWVKECQDRGQALTYAGVNAHHQNGIAERRIRTLQELARTMLLHASKRWPKTVTTNLWPYALRMANEMLNQTPSMQDKRRRAPLQIFAGSDVSCELKDYKPFGCPAYCLDNDLQLQQPFHKWKARARLGIYLGSSPVHARNVALVLDRDTGYVSPQFHVTCDTSFRTVADDQKGAKWRLRKHFAIRPSPDHTAKREKTTPITIKPSSKPRKLRLMEQNDVERLRQRRKRQKTAQHEQGNLVSEGETDPNNTDHKSNDTINRPKNTDVPIDEIPNNEEQSTDHRRSRSGRQIRQRKRLIESMAAKITSQRRDGQPEGIVEGELLAYLAMDERTDPMAYKATTDPDTMYWHQAMKEPDRDEFVKASIKEVDDQINNGIFSIVPATEVPKGVKPLPAVWQMKRKRDIRSRKVKKWKARLNIDGSRMSPDQYDLTYAPVASWNSIRLLLALTTIHKWHTIQIDYVLAFPQAPVERELYMKIPVGFEVPGANPNDFVLKIHRNIYGQKQAGKVWNSYLVDKLKGLGFKQSTSDECVLYKGNVMYVLYTDDSILAGPDKAELEKVIEEIKASGLNITVEGDLQDFLGVRIDRNEDGTIALTQPQLIDQILSDLRMQDEDVRTKDTPATSSKILKRHQDEEKFDRSFDYRSVIGKLNYLEKGSRPDIAYISHQCARFSQDPRKPHADAIRWLGRYLKGTQTKGTIIRPDRQRELEVFVDADFSGNWDNTDTANPDTARSRHGYIITYGGCPIVWKSQLQTEIALSSTESEYTGLSYALREAIPIMDLLHELKDAGFAIRSHKAQVHCKVFEDNSGALEMAKVHKYRPRTKHLNVKLHHFRRYVDSKAISIHRIDTNDQPADILTKPVNVDVLRKHRKTIMGW